jgi:hypothetical protein
MGVSKNDARALLKDVAWLANEGHAKHIGILSRNKRMSIRVNVFLLGVNVLLTSALWASLTRDAPASWVKYSGLTLSVIAAFASGLVVVLDYRKQNDLSAEATKMYGNVVFEATKFRITVENSASLSSNEEVELFRIYKKYNDMATKAGDRLAQLNDTSVWSEKAPTADNKSPLENPLASPTVRH